MVIYAGKDRIITKNEKFRLDPAEKKRKKQKIGGRRQAENISENAHRGHKAAGNRKRRREKAGIQHTQARRDTSHNM